MKKLNLFIVLFTLLFLISLIKADSPLTSTPISDAYTDLDIVVKAQKKSKMTKEFARFLHSGDNSIDEKAALINAIGWSFEGETNAESYAKYIYGKKLDELDLPSLKGDDLFCLGYLQALDDYFNPKKSFPYFEEAVKQNSTSLTVSLIHAIAKVQELMDKSDWCKVWEITYRTLNDKSLYRDLREEAIKIIKDYMILYKC